MDIKKIYSGLSVSAQISPQKALYLSGDYWFRNDTLKGSCPLTVERGKIVLAEFGYAGKLLPSFTQWLIDGQKPSRLAWFLKEKPLPQIYWRAKLKGKEWLAKPEIVG